METHAMTSPEPRPTPRWIYVLQVLSMSMIWVFVLGISTWILHLIRLARRLHDVPSASIAISIVAIPVFLTGASVLTYVFVGLQRDAVRGNGTDDAAAATEADNAADTKNEEEE